MSLVIGLDVTFIRKGSVVANRLDNTFIRKERVFANRGGHYIP